MSEKTYIIEIDPCPAPRMVRSDKWKGRKCVNKYFAFREEFVLKCNAAGYKLSQYLDVIFIIPMPKSWSKKVKQQMIHGGHQSKPDLDNLVKSVLDALTTDDSFVYHISATKIWGETGKIVLK